MSGLDKMLVQLIPIPPGKLDLRLLEVPYDPVHKHCLVF